MIRKGILKKGEKAPDFTLQDTEAKLISLDHLIEKGNCLILFFPLAFSGVCTDEMCVIRDNMKLYNSLNATVAGISVDSFFTLREFKKSYNLNFTLLSDFNKLVSNSYQCIYDDFYGLRGVSKRGAFVVDTDKTVLYAEVLEDSDQLPDFKSISRHLA